MQAADNSQRVIDDLKVIAVSRGIRFPAIGRGITGELLRQIPLGAVQRQARAFVAALLDIPGTVTSDLVEWGFHAKAQPTEEPARKPGGWSDLRYAKIAAAYVARVDVGSRSPVADVAQRLKLKGAQVRDAIHTARTRGLLTPTTKQGRIGGQLTARAEQLLRTQREGKKR